MEALAGGAVSDEWRADRPFCSGPSPFQLFSDSLLLSSLELSDTKSMSLKYEPSSEPLYNSAKQFHARLLEGVARFGSVTCGAFDFCHAGRIDFWRLRSGLLRVAFP